MGILGKIVRHLWGESEMCRNHPDKAAVSICKNCGSHYCSECLVEGPSYYYCREDACIRAGAEALDYAETPRFCPDCLTATTDESCGNLVTVNLIGSRLVKETAKDCHVCGSQELTKSTLVGSGPTYKVIWLDDQKEQFISRRLRETDTDTAQNDGQISSESELSDELSS